MAEEKRRPGRPRKNASANSNLGAMSIQELESLMTTKQAELDEAVATGQYGKVGALGSELESIKSKLDTARKQVDHNSVDTSRLESKIDDLTSAMHQLLGANTAMAQKLLESNLKIEAMNSKIEKMEANYLTETTSLKAEIARLNKLIATLNGNNGTFEDPANKEVDTEHKASPKNKKGATAKLKEAEAALESAKEEFKNQNVPTEYDDMASRQGTGSRVYDFISEFPTWHDIPEFVRTEILKEAKTNNDIYDIIANNQFYYDQLIEEKAMREEEENPIPDGDTSIDDIDPNDFESILDEENPFEE